jgi:secreted trypsin-like serine protease
MTKLILLSTILAGCVPDDVSWREVDAVSIDRAAAHDYFGTRAGIVGGASHTGNPETALLLPLDAQNQILGFCSSTLVGPRLLLTAAHCVDPSIPAAGFAAYFGTDFTAETDPGLLFIAFAEAVAIHPAWNPDDIVAGNDIAVIRLVETVPIAPKQVRTSPLGAADRNAPVELVGWGLTAGGANDTGVKRRVVSQLFDFDATLISIGSPGTNTCNGDSGGPAFLGDRVIGVTSFGDAGCATTGIDTRVDAFLDFLRAAGVDATPDPQEPDDPVAPPPDDDDECGKVFGCEDNQFPDSEREDDGGCSTGRGQGIASLLVFAALLSAGRRRRRAGR